MKGYDTGGFHIGCSGAGHLFVRQEETQEGSAIAGLVGYPAEAYFGNSGQRIFKDFLGTALDLQEAIELTELGQTYRSV